MNTMTTKAIACLLLVACLSGPAMAAAEQPFSKELEAALRQRAQLERRGAPAERLRRVDVKIRALQLFDETRAWEALVSTLDDAGTPPASSTPSSGYGPTLAAAWRDAADDRARKKLSERLVALFKQRS